MQKVLQIGLNSQSLNTNPLFPQKALCSKRKHPFVPFLLYFLPSQHTLPEYQWYMGDCTQLLSRLPPKRSLLIIEVNSQIRSLMQSTLVHLYFYSAEHFKFKNQAYLAWGLILRVPRRLYLWLMRLLECRDIIQYLLY